MLILLLCVVCFLAGAVVWTSIVLNNSWLLGKVADIVAKAQAAAKKL